MYILFTFFALGLTFLVLRILVRLSLYSSKIFAMEYSIRKYNEEILKTIVALDNK